jgi:hypothetical protein
VIGSGDRDGVDILVLEHLADVFVAFDFLIALLAFLNGFAEHFFVGIAQGDEAGAFDLGEGIDVRLASAVEADDGHANIIVGADGVEPGGEKRGRSDGRGSGQEAASRNASHDDPSALKMSCKLQV